MIKCQHCDAQVPDEEARAGWCEACGKKLPASAVAAIQPAGPRPLPQDRPATVTPGPPRPAPTRAASSSPSAHREVLIREQFRPVQAFLIALFFPPVGALLGLMGVGGLRGNGWGAVVFGLVLLALASAFLLIALLHAWMLLRRIASGRGPTLIAVRDEGITDYRTSPPTVTRWGEIDDVDVAYQSEGARVNEKRVILLLRAGDRQELDLRELDISTWKLKEIIRARLNDLRRQASPAPDTNVTLGPLVASFTAEFPLLDLVVGLPAVPAIGLVIGATLALTGTINRFTLTRRDDLIFLAFGVTVLAACAGYFLRRDRLFKDRIQVHERGVLVRGLLSVRAYFFTDIAGAVLLSRGAIPEAVVLKLHGGRERKLYTPPAQLVTLYRLINERS